MKLSESKIRTEYFIGYANEHEYDFVAEKATELLGDCTVSRSSGVWGGVPEQSLVVMQVGDGEINHDFIEEVKKGLYQDAVLVTQTPVQSTIY